MKRNPRYDRGNNQAISRTQHPHIQHVDIRGLGYHIYTCQSIARHIHFGKPLKEMIPTFYWISYWTRQRLLYIPNHSMLLFEISD